MEDFSNILWLLILAGSAAVSFIAKAKEAKRKAASAPHSTSHRAEEEVGPEQSPKNSATPIPETQQETVCAVYTPVSGTAKFTQLETEGTDSERTLVSMDRTAEPLVSNCNEMEVMDDFDLRKAIVWSEILKPKFEGE